MTKIITLCIGGIAILLAAGKIANELPPPEGKHAPNPKEKTTTSEKEQQSRPWYQRTSSGSQSTSDSTAIYESANRRAVSKYYTALNIAISTNPSSEGQDAAANFLAALDNVNWNYCSPELRNAAKSLGSTKDGDSMSLFKQRLASFLKVSNRYKD